MTKPTTPFIFGVLRDEGLNATLKGAFVHGQLVSCEFNGCTWKRHDGESAEGFEKRMTQDIREMLCGAQPSSLVESGAL